MIKFEDLTPNVYYNQSRDFQFLGRLFDIVLNSVKTNADLMYNNPFSDSSDEKLLDLLAMTLGFKSKHSYNVKQLTALCSAFCEIIRNKGNIKSIELALNTLLYAEGITESTTVTYKDGVIEMFIPPVVTDINIFKDLLNYVIPAGVGTEIVRTTTKGVPGATSKVDIKEEWLKHSWVDLREDKNNAIPKDFVNNKNDTQFTDDETNKLTPQNGLFINTAIPKL